ncbi:MAG: hypothetical protein IJN03_03320 [Bacilli bacterium]|nr:hypothetical protein [Bacilli bacterium]
MNSNNEITVLVDIGLEELLDILKKHNFIKINEYIMKDIYLLKKEMFESLEKNNILTVLNSSIIIRSIIMKHKEFKFITYKHKEYNSDLEIINQQKIECEIKSIEEAKELFAALGYDELIKIETLLKIYSNNIVDLVLQQVGDKILIEIEENDKNKIADLKKIVKELNIPIKDDNYFVKKAEIVIKEKFDF